MQTKLTITELTHEDLVNFLSDALCQGFFGAQYKQKDYNAIPKNKRHGDCFEDKLADILLNKGSIFISDLLADGEKHGNLPSKTDCDCGVVSYSVTLDDIIKGFSLDEAKEYVLQMQNEKDDAWTGYNLVQCVLFGEIVYG